MILVTKNQHIIATHLDSQRITLDMYPGAESIKQIIEGLNVQVGDDDPTIEHPEYLVNAPSDLPALFVHCTLSGGDGLEPPGIKNDGIDFLSASIAVRESSDPESNLIPLSESWRILIRDSKGQEYDNIKVYVTTGQASFNYRTSFAPRNLHIDDADFDTLEISGTTYQFKLANPVKFKVYRQI